MLQGLAHVLQVISLVNGASGSMDPIPEKSESSGAQWCSDDYFAN